MTPTRRLALAATLASTLVLGACGDTGSEDAAVTTTTASSGEEATTNSTSSDGSDHGVMSSESDALQCEMHMPGDLLTAEQAHVIMDTEHVCLGYVTVTTETPVTFNNTDTEPRTVTVFDDAGTELESFEIPAGGAVVRTFDTVGVFRFSYSGIEIFTGTVEVQAP